MYHGRFKETHYEAGYKWGELLYKLDKVYSFNENTTAFVEIEDGINGYGLAIGLTFIYPKVINVGFNAGMLDPYQYEPEERNIENETGFMDEDEEDFIGGI